MREFLGKGHKAFG